MVARDPDRVRTPRPEAAGASTICAMAAVASGGRGGMCGGNVRGAVGGGAAGGGGEAMAGIGVRVGSGGVAAEPESLGGAAVKKLPPGPGAPSHQPGSPRYHQPPGWSLEPSTTGPNTDTGG